MQKNGQNTIITSLLLNWYREHKRDLPWRETTDPYIIWISEIILQQTRVSQGWDYFLRFTRRFPNVSSLADAHEDEVLKLWQGLGYYSRARNMHAAAKQIMSRFNGKFPETYPDILSLKGVGEYTAAAISSIAFHLPHAVVDGNVFRVIARLFAIETPINTSEGKRIISEIAQSLLPPNNSGMHNQAIMDFGAMVCTPAQPKCADCPLQAYCMAYSEKRVQEFPVKNRKKTVRNRYFHYFHIVHGKNTFICKRSQSDIWKNLYEFPLIETETAKDFVQLQQTEVFRRLFPHQHTLFIDHRLSLKHVLSHQAIHAAFYRVTIPEDTSFNAPQNSIQIPENSLFDYPVSRLTHKYFEKF